jgi:peptidoglycan LD-endopeptidase LytH
MLYVLHQLLLRYASSFQSVVPFNSSTDRLLKLDFTAQNADLTAPLLEDTEAFSEYIEKKLSDGYTYGVGGYNEHRTVYSRSSVFDAEEEPRRLHLGIDIWGPAGTPIFAPMDGVVHGFAFNDNFGDYGATIILQHSLEGVEFFTLYGHLSLADISSLKEHQFIPGGTEFAHFGAAAENGHWPPHLHFQVIQNLNENKGDYPGVCKFSEKDIYLSNCPDPDLILQMMQYAESDNPQ